MRTRQPVVSFKHLPVVSAVVGTLLVSGCSADIARFDFNTASLGAEGVTPPPRSNLSEMGGGSRDLAPSAGYERDRAYSGRDTVERTALAPPPSSEPPVSRPYPDAARGYERDRDRDRGERDRNRDGDYADRRRDPAPPPSHDDRPPPAASNGADETIEVVRGDTLYSLARRHNVSVADLKRANQISGSSLRPGQRLTIPAGSRMIGASDRSEVARHETASEPAPAAHADRAPADRPRSDAAAVAEAPADWTGSYTVKSGDSLYAVARKYDVRLSDLERYNGIADSHRVKPGTTLKVPGDGTPPPPAAAVADAASDTPPASPRIETVRTRVASPAHPAVLNGRSNLPTRVARAEDPSVATDAAPAAEAAPPPARDDAAPSAPADTGTGAGKLRWPVTGRVVSPYGPRPDGTHNDGVNVAVPMGTDVHASESGVVAYAGDELKGYGNLVLLRHDNGWVTAYAHADEVMVKRGDRVRRGQVIAKAGRTGQVDQPQLHFELRQGQRPVDPTPFMDRM